MRTKASFSSLRSPICVMEFRKEFQPTYRFSHMNSHRDTGFREVIPSLFSVFCVANHLYNSSGRGFFFVQFADLPVPRWMARVTLPVAFNWQASRIGESLSPVKPS